MGVGDWAPAGPMQLVPARCHQAPQHGHIVIIVVAHDSLQAALSLSHLCGCVAINKSDAMLESCHNRFSHATIYLVYHICPSQTIIALVMP